MNSWDRSAGNVAPRKGSARGEPREYYMHVEPGCAKLQLNCRESEMFQERSSP